MRRKGIANRARGRATSDGEKGKATSIDQYRWETSRQYGRIAFVVTSGHRLIMEICILKTSLYPSVYTLATHLSDPS